MNMVLAEETYLLQVALTLPPPPHSGLCPQRPNEIYTIGANTGAFASRAPAIAHARYRQPHPCSLA